MEKLTDNKDLQKVFFNISSDAHIINLGFYTNVLSTLYYNNNIFINMFNENREDTLINLFIEKKEELKNCEYREELYRFIAQYEVHTDKSQKVLSHYIVVALYSYYERTLKSMLLKTGLCTEEEYQKMFKYKFLKKFFTDLFKFNYEDWSDEKFKLLEELRCLSNCIKHSGFVDKYLHKANDKWIPNQEIDDIYNDIPRFIDIPHIYLKIIVEKINNIYFK